MSYFNKKIYKGNNIVNSVMVMKKNFSILILGLFLMSFVFAGDVIFRDGNLDSQGNNLTNVGMLGVGTSSPLSPLHVSGASDSFDDPILSVESSGSQVPINFIQNGNLRALVRSDNSGNFVFSAQIGQIYFGLPDGNWKMIIKNNGNVGIGTTSPAYKLEVNGDTSFGETTFTSAVHHLADNVKTYWGASNDISFEFNTTYFIEKVEVGSIIKLVSGYVKTVFDHDVEIQGDLLVTGEINGTIDMFPFMVHQPTAYLTNLTNTTEIVNCGTPIINSNNYNSSTTQITISESGIYGIDYTLGVLLDSGFGGPRTRINTSMQYSNGTELIGSKAYTMYDDFWEGTGIQNSFIFNNSGEQTISLLISAALGTQGIDATIDDCQISIVRYGKQ